LDEGKIYDYLARLALYFSLQILGKLFTYRLDFGAHNSFAEGRQFTNHADICFVVDRTRRARLFR
jgi:hypothetical protein